jgi:hypothetical protein
VTSAEVDVPSVEVGEVQDEAVPDVVAAQPVEGGVHLVEQVVAPDTYYTE